MRVIPLFQLVPCKCIWSENGFDVILPSCPLAFWYSLFMNVWVDSKWEFSCEIFPLQGYNDDRWHICVIIAISFLQENSCTLQERPILVLFFFWFYNVAEVTIIHKMIKANLATKNVEVKRNQASFYIVCYTTGTKYKNVAFKKNICEVWWLENPKWVFRQSTKSNWKIQGPFIQRRFGEGVETYFSFHLSLCPGYIYSSKLRCTLHTI